MDPAQQHHILNNKCSKEYCDPEIGNECQSCFDKGIYRTKLQQGSLLESTIPMRTRAIVFDVLSDNEYVIVTDFGNISTLTEREVLSTYSPTKDLCSPDIWLQDKIKLIKELVNDYPYLRKFIDLTI